MLLSRGEVVLTAAAHPATAAEYAYEFARRFNKVLHVRRVAKVTVTNRRKLYEPTERGRATSCGGRGGKDAEEGEHRSATHAPDAEWERHVQGAGRCPQSSKGKKAERFTALLHHLNFDLLCDGFYAPKRQASPEIDGVTRQDWRIMRRRNGSA